MVIDVVGAGDLRSFRGNLQLSALEHGHLSWLALAKAPIVVSTGTNRRIRPFADLHLMAR